MVFPCSQPICVPSKVKSRLYADAIPGYFATNHSHINYYIDMSDLKHKQSLAMTVARSFAARMAGMPVDTILCLEGTEYIGAYLAQELTRESLSSMNTGRDLFLIEPDSNINGQFIFADNLRPMIDGKAVFVMVASASTGQTLSQIAECVEYYGGHVVGNAALFSNISELDGKPAVSLFTGADFPNYQICAHGKNCPACAAGIPLDAIVTPRGYRKL